MARSKKRGRRPAYSDEWYKLAVLGTRRADGDNFIGLRSAAAGFTAADGYDLRHVAEWSSAKRKRVERYHHELQNLTAQPRYVFRSRNKQHLQQAQRLGGHEPGFKFKVAFIPHTPKKDKRGKEIKPKVEFSKEGIRIRERNYEKRIIELDARRLAKDAKSEVARAVATIPRAKHFAVYAAPNEIPGSLVDRHFIADGVIRLMLKYDGKKPIPRGSGNFGDSPKYHKWDQWLTGLIAYEFPRATQQAVARAVNEYNDARLLLQKKRRAERKRLARRKRKR